MYLCYIDESGTPDIPGNTSHYVLAGVSIPVHYWKSCDSDLQTVKSRYGLSDEEIHVAWILRSYPEQRKIIGFEAMDHAQRRYQVNAYRNQELLRLQRGRKPLLYKQTKKNYAKTDSYIHLTYDERRSLIRDIATVLSQWEFACVFAECINKIHFDPARALKTVDEQAFEQIVSRFEKYLKAMNIENPNSFGLLIHDNNETVAKKHTILMKKFHENGTLWTKLRYIIETPLFVNSQLTGMVQIADLCGYALRRYVENGDTELFDLIFKRAHQKGTTVVSIRHFTNLSCACKVCEAHRPQLAQ